jgi:hypothetical protein
MNFDPIFEKLHTRLLLYGDRFKDLDSTWSKRTIFTIIQNAILSLKSQIENTEQREITWVKPFLEMRYAVKAEWEGDRITFPPEQIDMTKSAFLPESIKPLEDSIYDFLNITDFFILRCLTEDFVYLNRDKSLILFFEELDRPELWETFLEMKQKRETRLKKITKPFTFKIEDAVNDEKGRARKAKWILNVFFRPLIVDTCEREAYFPIHAELKFRGPHPSPWSKKDKGKFWDNLSYTVQLLIPNGGAIHLAKHLVQTRIEGMTDLPKPVARPATPDAHFIRVSLHAEKQKFPPLDVESLNPGIAQRAKEDYGIQEAGLDLTQAQSQALWAIQKLFSETNYGSLPEFTVPSLKFTPAEYLEAYGVSKYQTSRGSMEFSGEGRRQALQALGDLGGRNHILVYYRVRWQQKKGQFRQAQEKHPEETTGTLIKITQGPKALMRQVARPLDSVESTQKTMDPWLDVAAFLDSRDAAKETDNRTIVIKASPILSYQIIENYFVPKPANYRQEIKLLVGYGSKYIYNFIDYLLTKVAERESSRLGENEDWTITINYKELARALRMNSWIKTRNWKQIRGTLKKCYETARELQYIIFYEIDIPGKKKKETVDRLTLYPERYGRRLGDSEALGLKALALDEGGEVEVKPAEQSF